MNRCQNCWEWAREEVTLLSRCFDCWDWWLWYGRGVTR